MDNQSNSNKILRIHLQMPVAHWRVGFTQQNLHRTYPLPPPSTVLGMIHNLMGCKRGEVITGIDIAIIGKYDFIFYQFQTFRNLYNPSNPAYKESHIGGTMPNKVQLLGNVELYIYIKDKGIKKKEEPISFNELIDAFKNPRMPFILGRREDIAIIENPEEDIKEISLFQKTAPLRLEEFSLWIPNESNEANFLKGPTYLLTTYYKLDEKNNIRDFQRERDIYAEPQMIRPRDKEDGIYEEPKLTMDTVIIKNDKGKSKKIKIPVVFLGIKENKSGEKNGK